MGPLKQFIVPAICFATTMFFADRGQCQEIDKEVGATILKLRPLDEQLVKDPFCKISVKSYSDGYYVGVTFYLNHTENGRTVSFGDVPLARPLKAGSWKGSFGFNDSFDGSTFRGTWNIQNDDNTTSYYDVQIDIDENLNLLNSARYTVEETDGTSSKPKIVEKIVCEPFIS
jgi:hypothetical protein